jgi:hypothetical protein
MDRLFFDHLFYGRKLKILDDVFDIPAAVVAVD